MLRRRALLAGVGAFLIARRARAGESPIGTFPVAFAVAERDGAPVRDGAWLDAQLARAERLFGPHGVHLVRASRRTIDARFARLETRADRDALAALLLPRVINVFVTGALKDVDEPNRWRFGVHWRPTHATGKRYVILSGEAPTGVLAHELGHYFGNPHSKTPDNVMSYERTGQVEPFFDDAQIRIVRATARAVLASREVAGL